MPLAKGTAFVCFTITAFALYPGLKVFSLPTWRTKANHNHKTVIVTGATGTLGSAMAASIAQKKARVVMASRDMEKCKIIRREIVYFTGNKAITCRYLDLENIDSINKFVDNIAQEEPHIDVLINNAAVKQVPQKELTKYGIEKHYFVNFLGPFLLTMRLMKKLEDTARTNLDCRVINVIGKPESSWNVDLEDINFDKRRYSNKEAYEQSKLALAYFTILLEKFNREKKNHVYVYGVDPVYHNLQPWNTRPTGSAEQFVDMVKSYLSVKAERAASIAVRCALDPTYSRPTISGKLYGRMFLYWGWGKAEQDEIKAKHVWNMAAETLVQTPG